jgi:hypothetical protein
VSVTLHPPVRVVAIVAGLVLAGIAAFLLLVGRGLISSGTPAAAPSTVQHGSQPGTLHARPKPAAKPARVHLVAGLPDGIADELRVHRVVIVTVYVPGASVDAYVRSEARAAAGTTRAGYAGVSTASETALGRLVAKTGVLPDPAVVIMKRPGVVATTLGVADRDTIAQAVAQARGGR